MSDVEITFLSLAHDHGRWSNHQFGHEGERGPEGPLNHLKKEAVEALAAPTDAMEYADLFLLVLDASRRAGIQPKDLLLFAKAKLEINRRRKWGTANADGSVEHIRGRT